jgi:hypothetical protein
MLSIFFCVLGLLARIGAEFAKLNIHKRYEDVATSLFMLL